MRRILLVAAALLVSLSAAHWSGEAAAQTQHLVFGLVESPGYQITFPDGSRDTLSTGELSALQFESEQRGRFEILPVGNVPIPPIDCPDLYPTGVMPTPPCGGGEWMVYLQVGNQGRAPAGPFVTRVSLTPPGGVRSTKCNFDTASLAVGAMTERLSCRMATSVPTTPVGDWVVTIQVDIGDAVGESNETNNEW